jgi:hypothetical protein
MLISMPTGTSTIFGAFQAILVLLASGANSALPDKLVRIQKFASEIFVLKRASFYAALQKEIHKLVRPAVKLMTDQHVQDWSSSSDVGTGLSDPVSSR